MSFLIQITCDDNKIYANSWLSYSESQQATITSKIFQEHNINAYNSVKKSIKRSISIAPTMVDTKEKFQQDIVRNIWKETRKGLKQWMELVCI